MEDQVLERALSFLPNELSASGRLRLKKLCSIAVAQLTGRLKAGAEPRELGEQFLCAAGVLALSLYVTLGGDDFRKVTVGSVTVEQMRSGRDLIDGLRELSERILMGCLKEQGFAFTEVRG